MTHNKKSPEKPGRFIAHAAPISELLGHSAIVGRAWQCIHPVVGAPDYYVAPWGSALHIHWGGRLPHWGRHGKIRIDCTKQIASELTV